MGKRMISLLLSLVLLAGMTAVVPTVGAAETQSEQTGASGTTGSCTWSLSGTVLTISGNGRMKDYNVSYNSKPPWGTNITQVIVNYGVTYIGEDAFYGCENLTEVHLADVQEFGGDRDPRFGGDDPKLCVRLLLCFERGHAIKESELSRL